MKIRNCQYVHCGAPLPDSHGNLDYCPDKNCAYLAKMERQNKNYKIGENSKKAIQKNCQIFLTLLGETAMGEFDLMAVLKMGFDADGFYGSILHGEPKKKLFKVHDYYFHLPAGTPQKIQIWKA